MSGIYKCVTYVLKTIVCSTRQKYPITIQEALDSPASLVKKAWAGLNIFDIRVNSMYLTRNSLECLKHIKIK